jgi:hypothetical protein
MHRNVSEMNDMAELLKEMLLLDDALFAIHSRQIIEEERNSALTLKTFSLPFLSAQLGILGSYPPEVRSLNLEIYSYINRLNKEIDLAWWFYKQTFNSDTMSYSGDIIQANIEKTYDFIQSMLKRSIILIH